MESMLLEKIGEQIRLNKKVALATITKIEGSTPRKEGSMMVIFEDGRILGTIGGGTLELVVTKTGIRSIETAKSGSFHFELNDDEGSLHMQCGGSADIFIKVFVPKDKLVIAGAGHIAMDLYQLGKMLGFYTIVLDDRDEFLNFDRFPHADELILGNIGKNLLAYSMDENCYVVIVTRGHKHDEDALKSVILSSAGYIGMIGSKNKTKYVMDNLRAQGISEERITKVYAPIGLQLGGETPKEIAFSIMSEILLVKNNGRSAHMKE